MTIDVGQFLQKKGGQQRFVANRLKIMKGGDKNG